MLSSFATSGKTLFSVGDQPASPPPPLSPAFQIHGIMGGCASRPKDLAVKAEEVPEAAISQKEANQGSHTAEVAAEAEKPKDEVAAVEEEPKVEAHQESQPEVQAHEKKAEAQESKSEETKVEAVVKTPE